MSYQRKIKFEKWVDPIEHDNTGPVIVGPMGIISTTEGTELDKIYNLYLMHTNFDITPKIKEQLDELPGIEALDVFSRYRARIGIGLLFNEFKIFNSVEDLLIPQEPEFNLEEKKVEIVEKVNNPNERLISLKQIISLNNKNWLVYIDKENNLLFETDDDLEKLKNKFESLKDNIERSEKSW